MLDFVKEYGFNIYSQNGEGNNPVIYKITSPSGKIYIGQSWNVEARIRYYSGSIKPKQPKLYNSIKKYGFSAHKFEIVHELPNDIEQSVLDTYEQLYMDLYKDADFELLNVREGGSRGKHSSDSKEKMKGKIGKWMTGRILSEETIIKRTEKLKGLKRNNESKERYRESKTGDKNPMFGKEAPNRILTNKQVEEIRKTPIVNKYGHCVMLGKIYGVSNVTISSILTNRSRRA